MSKLKERMYSVEVYKDQDGETMVYLAAEGSSGCKYPASSAEEVGKHLADYIESFDGEE